MSDTSLFKVVGSYAECRLVGPLSLTEVVKSVTDAILLARERQIRQLLVVATGLTGLKSPSVTDRYFFIGEWARAANGDIAVALVVTAEMIDPKKFGITVARNLGFYAEVFTVEEPALAWLQTH